MSPGWDQFEERRSYWVYLFARRKPDVSLEQARVAINAIYSPIINDVEAPLQKGMSDPTMVQFRAKKITVEDGRRGQSSVHRDTRTPMLMLGAITGIVLLTACANIANLLLAQTCQRSREFAVRTSLGATRGRLVRQLTAESLGLFSIAGAAGIGIAPAITSGLIAQYPGALPLAQGTRGAGRLTGQALRNVEK